jgi:hypothetical protein
MENDLDQLLADTDPAAAPKVPEGDDISPRVFNKAVKQDTDDNSLELQNIIDANQKPMEPSKPGVAPADSPIDELAETDPQQVSFPKQIMRGAGTTVNNMADATTSGLLHGPMKAVDNMFELVGAGSDWLDATVPLGGFQLFDKDWNFDPKYLFPSEMEQDIKEGKDFRAGVPQGLIDFVAPRTTSGNIASAIGQFATSVWLGNRFVPGAPANAGKIVQTARNVGVTGGGTFVGFDGTEGRLSDLVNQYPALRNPVTEWLATDKDDGTLEARLKTALEGEVAAPILGGVVKAFASGLKMYKALKAKKVEMDAAPPPKFAEPPVPEGMVRMYHGGQRYDGDGARWLTSSRSHAEGYVAKGEGSAELQFIDLPENHPLIKANETGIEGQGIKEGFTVQFEAPADVVKDMKPVMQQADEAAKAAPKVVDPDTLLGDPDAPLFDTKPSGTPAKLREAMKNLDDPNLISEEMMGKVASGAEPIKIGKEPVYINFAHINSEQDVKQVIQFLSNNAKDAVDDARRGTATWEKSGARASAIDGWQAVLERRKGTALNAEELIAVRELWISTADKTFRLAKIAASDASPSNVYAARRMTAIFQMVNAQVLGATAEAGRALNVLRRPLGVTTEHLPKYLNQALEMTGGVEQNAQFFGRLAAMADDPDAFAKLAEKLEPTAMERILGGVQDFWIGGSLLSGPKTQMRNLISNTATMLNEAMERQVAGKVGSALDNAGSFDGEGTAYLIGTMNNLRQSFTAAGRAMWRNESAFGSTQFDMGPSRLSSKGTMVEGTPLGWAVEALGAYSSLSSRALVSQDEFFKSVNYSGALSWLAHREAMSEVSRGKLARSDVKDRIAEFLAHPTPEMRAKAYDQAHYATFTSPPGEITKAILRMTQKHPSLRFVVPFVRTPANLFKYAFERSPLGFTSQRYKEAIEMGGPQATLARTRIGMGTAMTLMALDLALEGKIVGDPTAYVQNPNEKDWIRKNSMPFSIAIKQDDGTVRHFSYQGTDPIGLTLGMAASIAEAVKSSGDAEWDDEDDENLARAVTSMMFYAGDYAMSRSYMSGVSDFFQAINDPQMNAERWQNRFASSFVPNWMNEANRVMDPIVRDGSTMANAVQRKVLFMSEGVPAVRDRFGRTASYESGLGQAYDTISPFYSKKVELTPWEAEEKRQGFYIAAPSSRLVIDKVPISFKGKPSLYLELKKIRGQMKPSEMGDTKEAQRLIDKYGDDNLLDLLNGIASGNHPLYLEYHSLSDGEGNEKDAFIDKIVRDYTKAAKRKLVDDSVEIQMMFEQSAKKKLHRDARID